MDLKPVLVLILAILSGLNTTGRLSHNAKIALAWVSGSLACVPVIINVLVWLFGSGSKWEPIKIGIMEIIFCNFSNQVLSWLALNERGVYSDISKLKEPTTVEDFVYVLMPHPHHLTEPFPGFRGSQLIEFDVMVNLIREKLGMSEITWQNTIQFPVNKLSVVSSCSYRINDLRISVTYLKSADHQYGCVIVCSHVGCKYQKRSSTFFRTFHGWVAFNYILCMWAEKEIGILDLEIRSPRFFRGDSISICHGMSVMKLIQRLKGIDASIRQFYTEEDVSPIEVMELLNVSYPVYKVGLDTGNTYSTS
jgi:hypothetical protein